MTDNNNQPASGSYSLIYSFNDGVYVRPESGDISFSQCSSGSTSYCAVVTGLDTVTFDGAINSYNISLSVGADVQSGDTFSVNIPGGASIDVNQQSATPEPASLALGATGLLALMLSRFRRRKV